MSENIRNINLAQSNVSVYKTKNISSNLSITLFLLRLNTLLPQGVSDIISMAK